jgi:hypothetical protein
MASMKFNITLDNNGTETQQEVNVKIADLARYDIIRNKYGFPKQDEGQFLFMVLVSYCSLIRTGGIPITTKPEDFIDTVSEIEPVEEAEDEAEDSKSL